MLHPQTRVWYSTGAAKRGFMTDEYNGQTALVKKIEELLGSKRISTTAALRLMLEKQLYDIKANHERDLRIAQLEGASLGLWVKNNQRRAVAIVIIMYSFSISTIREPFLTWVGSLISLVMKAI